jgi:hypothetical protein
MHPLVINKYVVILNLSLLLLVVELYYQYAYNMIHKSDEGELNVKCSE